MRKTALTRAYQRAIERWNLSPEQIRVSERWRTITIQVGRAKHKERFDPYTPYVKVLSWISRKVLAVEIAKKSEFEAAMRRLQKPLF